MSTDPTWNPEQLFKLDPDGNWWIKFPMAETIDAFYKDPQKALDFVLFALQLPRDRYETMIDAAVSHVAEEDLPVLASTALRILQANPMHKRANRLIGDIGLQRPTILHPYLQSLYKLKFHVRTTYPWRESSDLYLDFLSAERWKEGLDRRDWAFAQRCLLEARSPSTLHAALAPLSKPLSSVGGETYLLSEVGFHLKDGSLDPLYQEQSWHLTFTESGYMPRWHFQDHHHPTWSLATEPEEHLFGGTLEDRICGVCGQPLHRLISLEPVPAELHVSLPQLTFATCLSCMGWDGGVLYYQHDSQGLPISLDVQEVFDEPEFPAQPLPTTRVQLAKSPPRWRWQEWGNANSRQNLHRLGGYPSWVQSPDYPECSQCGKVMTFILQLDSDLPTTEGDAWLWGSGGIAYTFWCDSCRVSAFHWQCT
ncbi:DUF1963 domain-containing protein [Deinococcus roseus]|uniref:DUF1963 domain-containing protein n=1 Tax=Deinococcus roseus TaxID=392414 RepID=UPI0016698DDB|nr:hypothetical protein [Deinococcus roseus]